VSDSVKQILIIGLGLIGSSIAKASKNKGIIVHGFDINESSLSTALEDNIIDSSFDSIESINHKDLVDKIDLIVISVSPKNTQNILNQIKNLWNTNITITETASVKNHLNISSASNIILSHPIAGSHKSGISSIDENLFQNKKTIVCNPNNVNDIHINKLNNFWKHAMQMRVSEMSVKEHDLLFAMTSHLPHLISYALIDSIRLSSKDVEDNAGGGLKEFIRLSGSNAEMWSDIFELNDKNIIKSLASFQLSINNLLELIAKTKEIPEVFSHSELLEKELDEIKKYKEDNL
jgi:prephenate dehydrogenase